MTTITTSEKFSICNKRTSLNEGGFSNSPNDKGGCTYCGISEVMHPEWIGWAIVHARDKIKPLKQGEFILDNNLDKMVDDFYRKNFFEANRLGEINNQDVINELYDTGVNMGTITAIIFLQKALNLLNRNQQDYTDIIEDGIVGPTTLRLVNNITNIKALIKTLNGLQFMRYVEICERDKSQEANFIGWLTRIEY